MIDEFRAAFQRVLDTAAAQSPDFPEAVHDVFRLSSEVPVGELSHAMEALAPVLSDCEQVAGVAADLAILAGALVERGAPAGQVGLEVLRQLGSYGQAAAAFMHAWDKTGGGRPPEPGDLTGEEEKRVEEVLGDNAPLATVGWWTSLRYGLAAKAMLSDSGVRAAVRADAGALEGLTQIVHALATRLHEFVELGELLRMAEVEYLVVLDRASWRGFRVRVNGVGDNFQLHTLLADALVGKEGRRLSGNRPDPRWTTAYLDGAVDPLADTVTGEWDLVGSNGEWVGNDAVPADIPVSHGERVLVLEPQSLALSWKAGRRHPHIPGFLEVVEELNPQEVTAWWSRTHPAGSVRHPQAPRIEGEDEDPRPPRHFGVAAHFAEADSGPISAPFAALPPEMSDPPRPDAFGPGPLDPPVPVSASGDPLAPHDGPLDPPDAHGSGSGPVHVPGDVDGFPGPPPAGDAFAPGDLFSPLSPADRPAAGEGPASSGEGPASSGEGAASSDASGEVPPPAETGPADRSEPSAPHSAPGASLLPPMPEGTTDDHWSWGPDWKWPPPPRG